MGHMQDERPTLSEAINDNANKRIMGGAGGIQQHRGQPMNVDLRHPKRRDL